MDIAREALQYPISLGFLLVVVVVLLRNLLQVDMASLAMGMGRALAKLVVGPWEYVRGASTDLIQAGSEPSVGDPADKQLLTAYLLRFGEVGIVAIALFLPVAGTVVGWHGMLPDWGAVSERRDLRGRSRELSQELADARQRMEALDSAWRSDSLSVAQQLETRLRSTISSAEESLASWELELLDRPASAISAEYRGLLDQLRSQNPRDEAEVDGGTTRFEQQIQPLERSLANLDSVATSRLGFRDGDLSLLWNFSRTWALSSKARITLRNLDLTRRALQPAAVEVRGEVASLEAEAPRVQARFDSLKPAATWHPLRLVSGAGLGLFLATVVVWITGLLLEVAWLAVDVAKNVRLLSLQAGDGKRD